MARDGQVLRAGGWVAGRMVVRQDDGGGAHRQRRPEDLARLEGRDVEATHRDLLAADRLVARIQVEDGKALLRTASKVLELEERLPGWRDRGGSAGAGSVPAS